MPLIIVNGLPGSGKTTLATQLAAGLSLPLFRKDAIKETLADALTAIHPREETRIEWSQQLGLAAAACLWRLLSDADWKMWARNAEPLSLGTVHHVDTTQPVDIKRLLRVLARVISGYG